MSQNLKQAIKRVNSSTQGDKGKKQQVKGVKEQFVTLLGEYQVSPSSPLYELELELDPKHLQQLEGPARAPPMRTDLGLSSGCVSRALGLSM